MVEKLGWQNPNQAVEMNTTGDEVSNTMCCWEEMVRTQQHFQDILSKNVHPKLQGNIRHGHLEGYSTE